MIKKVKIKLPFTLLTILFSLPGFSHNSESEITDYQDSVLFEYAYMAEDWLYRDLDSSKVYSCLLLDAAIKFDNKEYLATAYIDLGYIYFYQHKINQALQHFSIAHNYLIEIGDSAYISENYMNFGNGYAELGAYENGIEYYQKAENYVPTDPYWRDYSLAFVFFNTAQTFLDLEDFENCGHYLAKSEFHALRDSATHLMHAIKNTKAVLMLQKNDLGKASKYANLALIEARKSGDLMEEAKSLEILAHIKSKKGESERSLKFQELSLEKARIYGDPYEVARSKKHLAQRLIEAGNPSKAEPLASQAYEYARSVGSNVLIKSTAKTYSDVLEARNKSEQALEIYKMYHAYSDSISQLGLREKLLQNESEISKQKNALLSTKTALQEELLNRNRIIIMIAAFVLLISLILIVLLIHNLRQKRKNQHIIEEKQTLINEKSDELTKRNAELKQLNDGKNKLFSILTHDLKQPFNQTINLLELLENFDIKDDELKDLISQVRKATTETRSTVDNLLTWSKSQFTNVRTLPAPVAVNNVVKSIYQENKQFFNEKKLDFDASIEAGLTVYADKYHFEIILRNLIQNAIKFSQVQSKIEIRGYANDTHARILIKDQGVGMDRQQLEQLFDVNRHFSTAGTLNEKGTGLGMLIVDEFVKENNGMLEVDSAPDEGSTFTLLFPLYFKNDIQSN